MFGNDKTKASGKIDTLIGRRTVVNGDFSFGGGLHVDGVIKGNVIADDGDDAVLTLSEEGTIEGEVRVPHVVINGVLMGDLYSTERVELAAKARVTGNCYYNLIEMAVGAEVNGQLVHDSQPQRHLPHQRPAVARETEATATGERDSVAEEGSS